ncbi:MAG: N-6 DNA methylase [Chloroflexi bacterium]|nr:N-6 DNA methylase [Chloroflexota bacterium]
MDDATEHTHRAALQALIESLLSGVSATNEPKHIKCGAPDFVIRKGAITVGYIEAKDIGKSLDETEKSDQLKRYLKSLSNLILTDYLEFRWYVDGEKRLSARLGTPAKDGKIRRDKAGLQAVAELLTTFLDHQAEKVGTPQELAQRMAKLAHMIRDLIIEASKQESEGGSLHTQLAAFRDNLIPDLSVEYFADMYAQTIAYGLFAAKCTIPDKKDFTRFDAAQNLPKTNPFLRKLFQHIAGYELDDRIAWLVDDLAQVLALADMEAVLKNFGKYIGKEDPVVHFYETFLKAYDPKVREMRGVYYTPEPVVSYIVHSIDHLLKTRFNKPQGLADDNTLILDPATGTATFLYMVINEIHQSFAGQEGMWNDYVAGKLLKRIFGFELLMAPYAVAHLKLGLLLKETGYKFHSDERLHIYLTNTLDEAFKHSETLFAQWISEEANAAAEIKKDKPIMVVLGNPPYSVSSANKSEHIEKLMERYKTAVRNERNIQPLSDDYIKFIRFAHERIERTGHGIIGMITNSSYLSGLIHRGMREELLKTFDEVYVLNLHGNAMLGKTDPDGNPDKNVFDIRQGVAIILLVRCQEHKELSKVHYKELWGIREIKYDYLSSSNISDTEWQILNPTLPYFFFVPANIEFKEEYEKGWSITDVFPIYSSGIKTHRDHLVIDYDDTVLKERITNFRGSQLSDEEIRESFGLEDTNSWSVANARKEIRDENNWEKAFTKCLYRPFDIRPIFFHKALIERTRPEVMHHMLSGENIALISMRQVAMNEPYSHFGVAQVVVDNRAFYSNRGIQCLFPLYLYPAEGEMQFEGGKRRPNLNTEFIKDISGKLGLTFVEDGRGDLEQTFGPEDIFHYAYAIFHSPTYRTRYAEFLKIDFPRLPLTSDKALFKALAEKGAELVSLHLMESPALNNLITEYPVTGDNTVDKVSYDDNNQRVYINKTQYFEGVPPEVWNFHIGGYQVCQKWLKDRKGRTLTYDELTHYQKVIVVLKETIQLMAEIDDLIPGWPVE